MKQSSANGPVRIDLNEMAIFTRVIQEGSFTAAARRLGMPKSTVSRKVSALEERVGARLVQRTTRRIGLTDAGRVYFGYCQRIVAEADAAERALGQLQESPRGLLRITAPNSFAPLGPIVCDFLLRHPEVRLEMMCTDRPVDLVAEGFDLAIRTGRLDDSTLVTRALGIVRWVVVASPAYCKKYGTPRTPADLSRHATLAFAVGSTPTTWQLRSDEKRVDVRLAPRAMIGDFRILMDAVRAGLGVAWTPESAIAADLREGRLKRVLPDWRSEDVPFQVVYPTARHLSPKVVAFVDALTKGLARRR